MLYNNNNISKKKIELERKQSYHISTSDMHGGGGGYTLTMCFRPNKSLNKLAPSAFSPISKLLEKQFQTLLDHS